MLTALESGPGLDVVIWLQAHGSSLLDSLAVFLHNAGGTLFYAALLALVFLAVSRPAGVRLLTAIITASVTTEALKALFQTPRPHLAYPDAVTPLVVQGGYGLPSGHTLMALAAWGTLAWIFRERWLTIFAALYVALMGWARMYAGVHYPQDVAGGLLFGGLLLWAINHYWEPLNSWWSARALPIQAALIGAGAIMIRLVAGEVGAPMAGLALGAGLGLAWEWRAVRFAPRASRPDRRLLNYVCGLLLMLMLYVGLAEAFSGLAPAALFRTIRYAAVGAGLAAVWPWLSVRLGLADSTLPAASNRT